MIQPGLETAALRHCKKTYYLQSLQSVTKRVSIYKKKVRFFYFLLRKSTSIFFLEFLESAPKTLRPSIFEVLKPHPKICDPAVRMAANRWESDGESSDDDDDDLPKRKK